MGSKHTKAGRKARRRGYFDALVRLGPQVPSSSVRLLWHSDYYDGPLSGMCRYRGEDLWFRMFDENQRHGGWHRRFDLVRLTADELADERRWHDLFRRCVGHHCDYDEKGRRAVGMVHPSAMHAEFYDAARNRASRDYKNNPIVGWFQR